MNRWEVQQKSNIALTYRQGCQRLLRLCLLWLDGCGLAGSWNWRAVGSAVNCGCTTRVRASSPTLRSSHTALPTSSGTDWHWLSAPHTSCCMSTATGEWPLESTPKLARTTLQVSRTTPESHRTTTESPPNWFPTRFALLLTVNNITRRSRFLTWTENETQRYSQTLHCN